MAHKTIQTVIDPDAEFDPDKRFWKMALFDSNGNPVGLGDSTPAPPAPAPALVGVGAPTMAAPDGTVYFERDVAGQTIAEWLREAGAWARILGAPPFASVARDTVQPGSAHNASTYLDFQTVVEDEVGAAAMYDPANRVVLTAKRAGIYTINAGGSWSGNATGYRRLNLMKTYAVAGSVQSPSAGTTPATGVALSMDLRLAVGDWVGVTMFHNAGSAVVLDITGRLSMRWVRP